MIINDNNKSIYTYNELTLTELLNKFFNEFGSIEEILKLKTDLKGNHEGSWQGLNKPTLSQEGAAAQVEKNAEIIDKLYTEKRENIIYVDDAEGDDENDGITNSVKTLSRAFEILVENGSKNLFGKWKIKIYPGVYEGVKVSNLPQFVETLEIEGTKVNGYHATYIQYDGDLQMGFWFEPMRGNSVKISNISFKNFSVDFNGYGVIGKNQGYLYIYDCEADNCDTGFAGINNVTLTCHRTVVSNCTYGFRTQYCSAATVGAGTGGAHMEEGGNGCIINDCEIGFLVTRNSVAHSDYVKYNKCTVAGLRVEMNSRVASLSCDYNSCDYGIQVWGGGECVLGTDGEKDTFTNCRIPYDMRGVGKLTRPYSLYAKNEFLFDNYFPSHMTNSNITGTTSETEVFRSSPSVTIPEYLLDSVNSKLRIKIYGTYKMPTSGTNFTTSLKLIGLNDDNTVNNCNINCGSIQNSVYSTSSTSFYNEYELVFTDSTFLRIVHSHVSNTSGGDTEKLSVYNTNSKQATDGKKQIRIFLTPSSEDVEVNIEYIEVYMTN